jgi:hypothetical protein
MKNNTRMTQRRREKSQKNNTRGGAKKTTPQKKTTPPKKTTAQKRAELYEHFLERFKKIADTYSPKLDNHTGFFNDDRVSKMEILLNEAKESYKSKKLTKTSFDLLEKKFVGFIDEPYSP